MKKNKTTPLPEQERMDLPGLGENELERPIKAENRPLEEPKSYEEAIAVAAESVDSGRALEKLNKLVEAAD